MNLPVCFMPAVLPETMSAAASYVEREYGGGYRIRVEAGGYSRAAFRVSHFDGSEFRILTDRYGNAWRLPDVADLTAAIAEHDAGRGARVADMEYPSSAR